MSGCHVTGRGVGYLYLPCEARVRLNKHSIIFKVLFVRLSPEDNGQNVGHTPAPTNLLVDGCVLHHVVLLYAVLVPTAREILTESLELLVIR